MTVEALCWCSHCGAARRLRTEGEYASCSSCGKVLLQLRGDAAAEEAPRPRRRPKMRIRGSTAAKKRAAADAADGSVVDVAGDNTRREISDAESNNR